MKNIDFYGNPVNINLKSHNVIKTEVGGYLTFLALLLTIAYFYLTSLDLFMKKKPKILQENKISNKPIDFLLTPDNYRIYFNLFQSDLVVVDMGKYFVIIYRSENVKKIVLQKLINYLMKDVKKNTSIRLLISSKQEQTF